jgi:dCMP deaminase
MNIMQQRMIDAYMDVAYRFAELSYAKRLQVGSIIVKDNRIISIGYNGTPSGWDNTCEYKEWMPEDLKDIYTTEKIEEMWPCAEYSDYDPDYIIGRYRLTTKPEVLHAEQNALAKLARSTESGEGAALFVTHAPCLQCAKNIYQSGIAEVYVGEHYKNDEGLDFL